MKTDIQSLYDQHLATLESAISVPSLRKKGIEIFNKLKLPDEKMENWKNFSLKEIYENDYKLELERKDINLSFFSGMDFGTSEDTLIFNNGLCSYENQLQKHKNGIVFGSMRAASIQYPDLINKFLNLANKNENGFTALNSALFNDGLFVYVPSGVEARVPYSLIEKYINDSNKIVLLRNLIVIERNSRLFIHHNSSSETRDKSLGLNVSEIFIDENSSLEWNTLQEFSGHTTVLNFEMAILKSNASIRRNIINLGSNNSRNELRVALTGTGAYADVNGAYILKNEEKLENRVFIDHGSAHCDSSQLFKGIIDNSASASFTGKILVRKDSQQTNAFQSAKNILLSEESKINMNPFLEIYADDVKCSHGASIGNIDPDALFYLMARGISEPDARKILLRSFVLEILDKISDEEYRNYLSEKIIHNLN
ncbi:MAG: Fe-S cluster assembly protein SufD [Deltaproteobacteria bacterium]